MMLYFLFFLLLLVFLFLIARPLTVLFHELGHAAAALVLTGEKVTIYIGTYGDPNKSIRFRLGLLEVFFRFNPFSWKLGLCHISAAKVSLNRRIIYVVTGPAASLIIAITAIYVTFTYDLHGFFKLFLIVFLISSLLDLVINLIPDPTPLVLFDGTITYCDGFQLKCLYRYKRVPGIYDKAAALYEKDRFAEAAVLFHKILSVGIKNPEIYRLAISSYILIKDYKNAKLLSEELGEQEERDAEDLYLEAHACSGLGLTEAALNLCDQGLEKDPAHVHMLNMKGYFLNEKQSYKEAIPLFDKAIEKDDTLAYAYNNRGYAKIKLGQREEGLKDVIHSINLDKNNAYAYRNQGIYHLETGETVEALQLFEKAKAMDSSVPLLEELIGEAKGNTECKSRDLQA